MIKNDQQLTVTLEQCDKLSNAIEALRQSGGDAVVTDIRIRALEADVRKLEGQVAGYRRAAEGKFDLESIAAVDRVGTELVNARIANGLTQDDLARFLGKKTQQVQRYERNLYKTASLGTLMAVASIFVGMRK